MGTVPTGRLERELRRMYTRWVSRLPLYRNRLSWYVDKFEKESTLLIESMGGDVAFLGAMLGFPAPTTLDLSPHVGTIYDDLKTAAIKAGITAGMNATDVARAMLESGMDSSFYRLNRLARTETVSAYWKNAWDSIADHDDLVMVWSSESGPRTCDYCLERDGLLVLDPSIRDHPNGRCTLVPKRLATLRYKGTLLPDGRVVQDPPKRPSKEDAPKKIT